MLKYLGESRFSVLTNVSHNILQSMGLSTQNLWMAEHEGDQHHDHLEMVTIMTNANQLFFISSCCCCGCHDLKAAKHKQTVLWKNQCYYKHVLRSHYRNYGEHKGLAVLNSKLSKLSP